VSSCTLFPTLVEWWTCVSSPLLSHTLHRRRTGGSRGAAQWGVWLDLGGVSQLTLWRQGWILVRLIFIFYFVRLPLCNKYSDDIVIFISIHSVIICVVFFGAYTICTRVWHRVSTHRSSQADGGEEMGLTWVWAQHEGFTFSFFQTQNFKLKLVLRIWIQMQRYKNIIMRCIFILIISCWN
jgi:hypothetical protein